VNQNERFYWAGVAVGIALGVSSFLLGCPWDSCFKPSLAGGYSTQLRKAP
jgi:hypothetical protein